jgi:hypothetical protein
VPIIYNRGPCGELSVFEWLSHLQLVTVFLCVCVCCNSQHHSESQVCFLFVRFEFLRCEGGWRGVNIAAFIQHRRAK